MKYILLFLPVALLLFSQVTALAPRPTSFTGKASITDGDGIKIGTQKIRLHGIDAFESKQLCYDLDENEIPCGRIATDQLTDIINGANVRCEVKDYDRHGRAVGLCFVGKTSISKEMVKRGYALVYRRYSQAYLAEEKAARKNQRGAWRYLFIPPWEWRHQR